MHIYIHIPFCIRKCSYCGFYSVIFNQELKCCFIDSLINEIDIYGHHFLDRNKLDCVDNLHNTLYIGGGTPSLLEFKDSQAIVNALNKSFAISAFDEFTIETNPDSLTESKLDGYRKLGVNRVSIGIQSLNDNILNSLGRVHDSAQAQNALQIAAGSGIRRISADLIYSIPGLETASFLKNIERVIELGATHISLYSLTVEPGTKIEKDVLSNKVRIPDTDTIAAQYYAASESLESLGFAAYEVSNFAQAGEESQHNMAYWTGESFFGFGPSAHSFCKNIRWANTLDVSKYIDAFSSEKLRIGDSHFGNNPESFLKKAGLPLDFAETLTRKDRITEIVMLGLRLRKGFSIDTLGDFAKTIIDTATPLFKNGILLYDGKSIKLAPGKRLLADAVAVKLVEII